MRALICFSILFITNGSQQANAGIFDSHIKKDPPAVNTLTIYFIDLSGSIDPTVPTDGVRNIRNRISEVYDDVKDVTKNGASSYFLWVPIRGSSQKFIINDLFSANLDKKIWSVAANANLGFSNQVTILEKVKRFNGLWSQILSKDLDPKGCLSQAENSLNANGISSSILINSSYAFCSAAFVSNQNLLLLQNTLNAYSANSSLAKGSDVIGAIDSVNRYLTTSGTDKKFRTIEYQFISDMNQNSSLLNFSQLLSNSDERGSRDLASKVAFGKPRLSNKYKISVWGIAEFTSPKKASTKIELQNSIKREESLRVNLNYFWDEYFKKLGTNPIQYDLKGSF